MDGEKDTDPGQGPSQGAPAPLSRSELALRRRAARERWGVPDELRTEAILTAQVFLRDGTARQKRAALSFLAAVDKIDQADERLQMEREKMQRPEPPPDARAALLGEALEMVRDRAGRAGSDPGGPGGVP